MKVKVIEKGKKFSVLISQDKEIFYLKSNSTEKDCKAVAKRFEKSLEKYRKIELKKVLNKMKKKKSLLGKLRKK